MLAWDTEEPLVWTTLGNVPVSMCEHTVEWFDEGGTVKFVESYLRDGVVIRRDAHVFVRRGADAAQAAGGTFGD